MKALFYCWIDRRIPAASEPKNPWTANTNGAQVEKNTRPRASLSSSRLQRGWTVPAIMPRRMAAMGLKMWGALVPIMAAPAKVPYMRSLILILPWMTADQAIEVTTDALMAQYALIIPFSPRKGDVVVEYWTPTAGTSQKMVG